MSVTDPASFWQDRAVLVTGATGLVGGWLVERLVESQSQVVCLVRDWVPKSRVLEELKECPVIVVRGDIRDQSLLERTLGEYEVNTVFHLAAQTIVGVANRNPAFTFDTNVRGTWSVLEACRRSPLVRGIIVASSDKAYGVQESLPYTESSPLLGRYPYDASKACTDILATSYATTFDLPVLVTRCGNFFGGGDLNWNRIVPGTIRSLLRGERPIIRSDGTYVRDYIYAEDAADAYITLARSLESRPELRGEAFNISTEEPLSVIEIVRKITDIVGSEVKPDVRDEAANEIPSQYLSAQKARSLLGWRPQFGLEEGLRRTIAWYRRFLAA